MLGRIVFLTGTSLFVLCISVASPAEKPPEATYTNCVSAGSSGNPDGYLTTYEDYRCAEGTVRLKGRWGLEIQNGWQYRLELGRLAGSEYVGDLTKEQQMPAFQIWEPTAHGYRLTGWNEAYDKQERLKLQERSKNPRPYQK